LRILRHWIKIWKTVAIYNWRLPHVVDCKYFQMSFEKNHDAFRALVFLSIEWLHLNQRKLKLSFRSSTHFHRLYTDSWDNSLLWTFLYWSSVEEHASHKPGFNGLPLAVAMIKNDRSLVLLSFDRLTFCIVFVVSSIYQ
jgi:hypothetical protein